MLVWFLWLPVLFSDIALSEHANDLPFRTLVELARVARVSLPQLPAKSVLCCAASPAYQRTPKEIKSASSLLCGQNGVAGVVRVVVSERMSFPSVRIDRHLRNVTITRQENGRGRCPGAALVDLRVGCLVAADRRARRTRHALQYLPLVGGTGLLTND
ncbi:unnamed protein product, partial [Brenthis ino]